MSSKNSQATIKDVARKAGASIVEVSRVLNGTTPVSSDTVARVLKAMEELDYVPPKRKSHFTHLNSPDNTIIFNYFVPDSYPLLTPDLLKDILSPYLIAVDSLQQVLNEIRSLPHRDISVREITQYSPISVSLDGAGGAIKSIEDIVIPWKRKHYEVMAKLDEQEKQVEIESKKADILEKRASAAKDRAEAQRLLVEANKQNREIDYSKIAYEKLKLELQHEKINLALDIINSIAPNLSQTEKIEYLLRLVQVIDVIGNSNFEIESVKPQMDLTFRKQS